MRALEFIRDHVTFKLPYHYSYQMKTPINRVNQGIPVLCFLAGSVDSVLALWFIGHVFESGTSKIISWTRFSIFIGSSLKKYPYILPEWRFLELTKKLNFMVRWKRPNPHLSGIIYASISSKITCTCKKIPKRTSLWEWGQMFIITEADVGQNRPKLNTLFAPKK